MTKSYKIRKVVNTILEVVVGIIMAGACLGSIILIINAACNWWSWSFVTTDFICFVINHDIFYYITMAVIWSWPVVFALAFIGTRIEPEES